MSVSLHYLVKHKVRVCVQSMKRKKHDVVATRGRGDVHPLTAARTCARNLLCIAMDIDVCVATLPCETQSVCVCVCSVHEA